MDVKAWQAQNLAAIDARLAELRTKENGVIYAKPSGVHFIIVTKTGSYLRVGLLEQGKPRSDLTQSWINLDDPLSLRAFYCQTAMVGLIWPTEMRRAYVTGFGGGRIPLLLHHYYPQVQVDCADIDAMMVEVACQYFGVRLDGRLNVAIQDGRRYLAEQGAEVQYDYMLIDVFLGNAYTPYRLATVEFYELCQSHLSADGVLIVNLLDSDPFYAEKVRTIQATFAHIYLCRIAGNSIIFASQGNTLDETEIMYRAEALNEEHHFAFPLMNRARQIVIGSELLYHIRNLDQARILTDASPPATYFDYLPSFEPAYNSFKDDQPCPCGSGEVFAACHGRQVQDDHSAG